MNLVRELELELPIALECAFVTEANKLFKDLYPTYNLVLGGSSSGSHFGMTTMGLAQEGIHQTMTPTFSSSFHIQAAHLKGMFGVSVRLVDFLMF